MFETRSGIFLIAGLGFFVLAFLSNGLVPVLMYADKKEQTVEDIIRAQLDAKSLQLKVEGKEGERKPGQRAAKGSGGRSWTIVDQFKDLQGRYAEQFIKYYGDPEKEKWDQDAWVAKTAEALRLGRQVYVGEACWHCHSQFVRPVSKEEERWGPVAASWEYHNELQRPVLFGTRRVGPDLSREGGRRGSDWHATHFFNPRWTSPNSVMPRYVWFFDGDAGKPNRRGLAMITYMQYLGSWLDDYPYVDNQLNPTQSETTR